MKNSKLHVSQVLGILWMIIWFLLIPMRFFVKLEKRASDIIFIIIIGALLLIALALALIAGFFSNSFSGSSLEIEENEKNLASEESTKSKSNNSQESNQECVFIILIIEEDYTKSSENEYLSEKDEYLSEEDESLSDSEDAFFVDNVHYPFRDVNARSINGSDTQEPFWTWSLGKVYLIDQDTKGKILWVWVQIHLYYPAPMPTPVIVRCTLSEDLGAHPIWRGDFVLLEYHRKADEEGFMSTFTIIKIENV